MTEPSSQVIERSTLTLDVVEWSGNLREADTDTFRQSSAQRRGETNSPVGHREWSPPTALGGPGPAAAMSVLIETRLAGADELGAEEAWLKTGIAIYFLRLSASRRKPI